MLAIAPTAVQAVKNIVEAASVPTETGGIRIFSGGSDPDASLMVEVAEEGQGDDVVVEQDGARIYVEADAATHLDGKVLDAMVDSNGRVGFQVIDSGA